MLLLEPDRQGVPLSDLIESGLLGQARCLTPRLDLGRRAVRSITLVLWPGADATPIPALRPDQLVLADLRIPTPPLDSSSLVEQVAQAECAALVLRCDAPLPATWLARAEAADLPVLQLPPELAPQELITPLVDELLRWEHALLYQTASIQQRLANQVLAGHQGQGIVDVLSPLLRKPILLIDHNAEILGQAGAWQRHPAWETLSRAEQLQAVIAPLTKRAQQRYALGGEPLPMLVNDAHLLLSPVVAGQRVAGWFILDTEMAALDTSARLTLEQATTIAALELDRQAAIRETERRLGSTFLDDLLGAELPSTVVEERTRRLGWDLSHKPVVMLVSWDNLVLSPLVRRQTLHFVERFFRAWRPQSLVLERENEILTLPHLPEAMDQHVPRELVHRLAQDMLRAWPDHLREVSAVIAVGGHQPSLEQLEVSYREARRALTVRKRMGLKRALLSFDEIRIYSFLERHLNDEEIRELVQHTIRLLVEYDAEKGTEFVRTMEAYFDCNLRLQKTAERLFVHPNSLKYRLQRIRDILGVDPFTDRDHLQYYLATKLMRLL